jgi:hypothetical protein
MEPQRKPTTQMFKTQPSAGNIIWDSEGVLHVDFLPLRLIVNAQYYSNLFLKDVHAPVNMTRPGKLPMGIILLHNNARPQTAYLITTLATLG